MEPKYAENIIVGVIFKKKFQWYITEKSIWRLDYRKFYDEWAATYRSRGKDQVTFIKEVGSFGEFLSTRFRIPVADKDTAKEFLKHISTEISSVGELAYLYDRAGTAEAQKALFPALLVNFDAKELYSQYPEKDIEFEKYVPQGWRASHRRFENLIPAAERFWAYA